jgi:hypothetical protein
MTGTRRARLLGAAAAAVLAALLAGLPAGVSAVAAPAAASGPAAGQSGQGKLAVLDIVMLVDESGSETATSIADETATAGQIVQSLLNPASRVTVVGFGGVNGVVPNQNPVDVACQPTIASGQQNLSYLSKCVTSLHKRSEAQGDDTDYAAALGQAMSYLSPSSTATPPSPSGAIKVIMMMTDGAADVHRDTTQYGSNTQLGEQQAIDQQLTAAKADDVQLWPLGFGNDAGTGITQDQAKAKLNMMASAAAPAVCDKQRVADQPHANWVNSSQDAINALDELYSDAACVGKNSKSTTIGPNQPNATLSVSIPEIASAAAISVDRGNPDVTVSYQMPNGQAWSDSSAISGQDSAVEVLHIYNVAKEDVGTWQVHLTAPSGQASELVQATVFWQGAVRALITANPPNAKLGQAINVSLEVLGPNGPVSDASTLKSLVVGVTASGDGLTGTVPVPVSGVAGQPGLYTGTLTAPNQASTVTITGTASGYGLYATEVPAQVGVGSQTAQFTATPGFGGQSSVQAGGTINGSVVFTNAGGTARQVRLVANVSGGTGTLTSPTGPITVSGTSPPSVPFTISIDKSSQTGTAFVTVQAVDASTGQVLNTAAQDFSITKPPGFLAKYWWALLALLILIILAVLAALWRRAVMRDRKNVRGLEVTLRSGGEQKGKLEAPQDVRYSEAFQFLIKDEATPHPYLSHLGRETMGVYRVTRGKQGFVRLVAPNALKPYDVELHGSPVTLDNGMELSFSDTRHANWGGTGFTPAPAPQGYGSTDYSGGAGYPGAGGGPGAGGAGGGNYGATASYGTYSPGDAWGNGGAAAPPPAPETPYPGTSGGQDDPDATTRRRPVSRPDQ